MTYEAQVAIVLTLLIATGVLVTLFPIAYSFSPWFRSREGRGLMFFAVAVALLVDATIWLYFRPLNNINVAFTVQVVAFGWASFASGYMLWALLMNQWRQVRVRFSRSGSSPLP